MKKLIIGLGVITVVAYAIPASRNRIRAAARQFQADFAQQEAFLKDALLAVQPAPNRR